VLGIDPKSANSVKHLNVVVIAGNEQSRNEGKREHSLDLEKSVTTLTTTPFFQNMTK